MIYEYNEEIVNRSNVFNDERNFIGYVLPDGSVFRCQNHNVSNVDSFLKLYLELLDTNFDKKEELIDVETDNKLAMIILKYLKKSTYDQIHALLEFTQKEEITIKDLLVSLFGCHLVTRLNNGNFLIFTSQGTYIYDPTYHYITFSASIIYNRDEDNIAHFSEEDNNGYIIFTSSFNHYIYFSDGTSYTSISHNLVLKYYDYSVVPYKHYNDSYFFHIYYNINYNNKICFYFYKYKIKKQRSIDQLYAHQYIPDYSYRFITCQLMRIYYFISK